MMAATLSRRALLKAGGALVVTFGMPSIAGAQRATAADRAPAPSIDTTSVDSFFAVHQDGSITCYCGKVDLGQGLRIAIRQMAAEELEVPVDRIALVEGDTALTPDQGPTAGSSGVMRGGVQIRQAAATARAALLALASQRMGRPASELMVVDGAVRARDGGSGVDFGALIGGRRFDVKLDPKAALKDPRLYRVVGQPLPRPDLPAKLTGRHVYVHDLVVLNMLHGRAIRPPRPGARLLEVDTNSIIGLDGARLVRKGDFIGVVAADEWTAVRAARALALKWSDAPPLAGAGDVAGWLRAGPFEATQSLVTKGDVAGTLGRHGTQCGGTYFWPMQTHGSIGPSCAVADVRADGATIYTASQATHKYRPTFARILGLPTDAVRLVYLDGAGCYGMNGHDDAAADAALLSQATGQPVRVQWMRGDEHGWDPKGPPQLVAMTASVTADGTIDAWRTEMWLPRATAGLPNVPLLGPDEAGIAQPPGISTGLITQNGDPPYGVANVEVVVHWLKGAPLRPSNIRAPGKIANVLAVEALTDELAFAAGVDPLAFRQRHVTDPRGSEVLRRAAARFGWTPRDTDARRQFGGRGHGLAYSHYKNNETYIAMVMEVDVDRANGAVRVRRVACAHDCGLAINPDGVKAQVEGGILQTLSRTLFEEVAFDRNGVTSRDWHSYPILRFSDAPEIHVDIVQRLTEPPLGAGEAACVCVAGALANAIFDAVGVRMRTVPFTAERVKAALASARASTA
ncbi:MAG: molybdopterin cofactor-binding domain-containing protein [Betaproteobacteria bacterium]